MSKSFQNSSLGRDLPPQSKLDPSRMGLGQMGQGSRVSSLMDLDSAKMGPQRSHGMMSSGSSPQSLSSAFRLGGRGPASSQSGRESDPASKILASFGLSSSDLDELSRFPEDKITAENLPEIIQHLKRRRAQQTDRLSRDNWDNLRSLRGGFDDRPSGLNPGGDFGHGGGSREPSFRDRMDMDDSLRERERLRGDPFLSDPFRKNESDYNRMGYGSVQERSMFDKPRGMPSGRNIDDFHGLPPKAFPHLCSLCDFPLNNFQNWNEHILGRLHKKQCLLLLELFPQWKGHGMGADPFMLQRSTNPAPGIMGPPPAPMNMGGPGGHRGNIGGRPGMEGMQGPRPMQKKQGGGRVVHVVDIQRTKTLKPQLMKLVEPFGTVTNSLILNSTKEAFIEMATPAQARAVVNYYEMNPAYVYGKPVRVLLSLKYKEIKKKEDADGNFQQRAQPNRQGPKPQSAEGSDKPVEGLGRVLRICNLPKSDYADNSVVQLAKKYGKVVNYILMRKMRQAFIEMERMEDAQAMIEQCAKTPLIFKGGALQVLISQKYSHLVLKIPNDSLQRKNSRKRSRSLDGKSSNKKQRNEKADADIVTTEEDLVTDSCDPELEDEEEDDEETDVSNLEASGSGDEAEVPDISDLDRSDSLEPFSSTPAPAGDESSSALRGIMEDEEGNQTTELNSVEANKIEGDMEVDKNTESQTAPDSEGLLEANAGLTVEELGPYQPNVPTGVNYVIPKTGYYCRLCSLFYTNEDMAKVTHCSSLAHYQKLKNLLTKSSPSKSPEENTEQ